MTRMRGAILTVALALTLPAACESDGDGGANPDGGGGGSGGGGGGPAVQLLTFTGPISGSMSEATTDCWKTAGPPAQLNISLNGKVAATDRRVKIVINNFIGIGNYGGNAVQVEIDGTGVTGDEAAVSTEKSGTVESGTNRDGNKVTGSWSCASAPATR